MTNTPYRPEWRHRSDMQLSAGLLEGEAGPTATGNVLVDALTKCRDQFRFYETSHMAKGSIDGDAKARTNCEFAEMCDAALQATQADIGKDAGEREVLLANLERLKSWCRAQDPNATIWLHIDQAIAALSPSPVKDALEAAAKVCDRLDSLIDGRGLPWEHNQVFQYGNLLRDEVIAETGMVADDIHDPADAALIVEAVNALPELIASIRNLAGQSREKA